MANQPQPLTADQQAKMKEVCQRYNVSEKLMTGLLMQESGNNKNAKSGTGCVGYYQFQRDTFWAMQNPGKGNAPKGLPPLSGPDLEFGVQVEAAAKLMKQNLDRYKGNDRQEGLALVAYNAGPTVADKVKGNLSAGQTWADSCEKAVKDTPGIADLPNKVKEVTNFPGGVLGKSATYNSDTEKKSQNQFVVSEGMSSIYEAIHDSSVIDLTRSTQSLVIKEGLSTTPWFKDPTAMVGNPKLKSIQPIWFKVLLSPTNFLSDSNGVDVQLRLNCSLASMELSMKHKYNKTPTRTGMHITLWGMEPDMVSGSGSTGAWMNQFGLTQFMSSEKASPEMLEYIDSQKLPTTFDKGQFFKQFQKGYKPPAQGGPNLKVAAQDSFVELLALFKYNAITRFKNDGYTGYFTDRDQLGANVWSDQFGASTFVAGARNNDVMYRGDVVMGTKDDIYTGYFKSLSFTEDSEKPYRWNFNFTFQVQTKNKFTGTPT